MSSNTQNQIENETRERTIEIQFDLKVSAEAVWLALTDAQELSRWFAPQIQLKPGASGVITRQWSSTLKDEWPIAIWEPNQRLRILHGGTNRPGARPTGVDYFIEDRGGGTSRLRLVSFGFSSDAKWDKMYDCVSRGWDVLLWELKEYVDHHFGKPRTVISLNVALSMPCSEAWKRLVSPGGPFSAELSTASSGSRFDLTIGTERLNGIVRKVSHTDHYLQAIVENLNHALLRVDCYEGMDGVNTLVFSINTFELEAARTQKIRQALAGDLKLLLGM